MKNKNISLFKDEISVHLLKPNGLFLQETCFLWLKSKKENVGGSLYLTIKSQPIGWWSFHPT